MSNTKFLTRRRFLEITGAGLAALSGMSALSGCQPTGSSDETEGESAAVNTDGKNVVKVYNWTEYISDDVLKAFTKETGIEVVYSTFDSNEAMYAKLKLMNNRGDYDIIFPSTDFVDKMRKEGMLEQIDHSKLPNFKHLGKAFLDAGFDPENKFSIPYLWGSSGIAVNKNRVDIDTIRSWNDLWRPEFEGRVMLMNDMRDVFIIGLLVLGYPVMTEDPQHIKE